MIGTPGALGPVLDQLVALGEQVSETEDLTASERLLVHRWKPPRPPVRFPALWHWIQPDAPPPEQKDTNRLRDILIISAFVGVKHSDQDKDLARLETLSDAYRDIVDPAVWTNQPLGGTVTWGKRLAMRFVSVEWAGVECLAAEFPLEVWLDRQLVKSN